MPQDDDDAEQSGRREEYFKQPLVLIHEGRGKGESSEWSWCKYLIVGFEVSRLAAGEQLVADIHQHSAK